MRREALVGFGEETTPDSLGPGESYTQTVQGSVPFAGLFYVHVVTDHLDFFEETGEGSANRSVAVPVLAVGGVGPLPDLAVDSFEITAVDSALREATVTWTVENRGSVAAIGAEMKGCLKRKAMKKSSMLPASASVSIPAAKSET